MYTKETREQINNVIEKHYKNLHKIEEGDKITNSGVGRLVMLDRYSRKDMDLETLQEGDIVVTVIREDPKYPAKGIGKAIELSDDKVTILIDKEFRGSLGDDTGIVVKKISEVEKPLELYYEQIAKRVGGALAEVEGAESTKFAEQFTKELSEMNIIPAGRVLHGAGSGTEVTYFNCFVMPYPKDSRGGIAKHREETMEIMSRGGGVGTNGSTLRPKHTQAKGVGGRSSGAVSWLDDIANLTHLVEQGGSRRGAQMIMLADWHPDIIEFIVSKMQNPRVLRYLIENASDEVVRAEAAKKLKFTPLTQDEIQMYEEIVKHSSGHIKKIAEEKLAEGGEYSVNNEEFLTGANISVTLTKEFMDAVENDGEFELRFPDIDNYSKEEKAYYDEHWHEVGDVREWESKGYAVKTYRTIKARDLWDLISFCATYSAEPGIFFIDNANDMTNAKGYGQKVVATNPCWTGDTLVSTINGPVSFKELATKGEDIEVFSLDTTTKEIVVRAMRNPRLTRENAEIYELIVTDEEVAGSKEAYENRSSSYKATADHNVYIYTDNGIEKRMLKDLKKGDRLVAQQTKGLNEGDIDLYSRLVESVEFVGNEDVYNGTVDEFHNYFICDGIANSENEITGILSANCGEQPLAPYSVCNLASINLANFVDKKTGEILYDKLAETVKTQVRLQDNVIDSTPYFLEANKEQALGERRLGLGVMGLHDMLIWAKVRYGSPESLVIINKVFKKIAETAYEYSVDLAKEKGSFPFLKDREKFVQSGYLQHMSQELRDSIVEHGIRNSHLLTIAPTGSTGTMVGCSTGLEPYFSFSYFRSGRLGKFIEVNAEIVDEWLSYNPEYTADSLPGYFVSAMELTPEEHADVQAAIQYWIDSSISKTVNAPRGFTVKQVQRIYERLYKKGAKGGTVYVDGSRESQVLSLSAEENSDWSEVGDEKVDVAVEVKQKEDRNIGTNPGDTCPICNEGTVEVIGGCNTCTSCNTQLSCGL